MHPQLEEIGNEFAAATERFERLVAATPDDRWHTRPAPGRWSVAECIAHLNLSSEAFIPLLREAMRSAPRGGHQRRYRRTLMGWMLWRMMPPPVKFGRAPTIAAMIPGAELDRQFVSDEFLRLQQEQVALLSEAEGVPIDQLRIVSPFSSRVKYDVFSALSILPRHQDRHIWQAERALEQLAGRADGPG
jgi:hypothetical protein